MTNHRTTTDLIPAAELPLGDRIRLGVVRTVAVGLLASGAFVAVTSAAGAKPIPQFPVDIDDLTVETIPPITIPPTTVKPPVFPPFTIPPVILDPGTSPTTVPPTVPPTIPPVVVNPTTTVKPPVPTIPPVIVNPTVPPTTVAPPADPDPTVPTPDPTEPTVPTEVEGATVAASPDQLAVTGNNSALPIIGASLVGAGALIAGGVAYDRRRRTRD